MVLEIKEISSDKDCIELRKGGDCVDVIINTRIVAGCWDNGMVKVWDEDDNGAWDGRWKK